MTNTNRKNITLTRCDYDRLVKYGNAEIAAREGIDAKAIGFVTRWVQGQHNPRTAGYTEKNDTTRRATVKHISNQYGDKWFIELVVESTDNTVRGADTMDKNEKATRRQAEQMIQIAAANVDKGSMKSSAAQCLKDAHECIAQGIAVEFKTMARGTFLADYFNACMWALRSLAYSVGLHSKEYAKARMIFESYEVEPASKIGANNEIPPGRGRIEDVSHLVQKWFACETLTVISTGGGEGTDTNEGDLRFNLVYTYGTGEHAVTYAKAFEYKNFVESEIGRAIGQIQMFHAALCNLNRAAAEWLKAKGEASPALERAIDQLPMMGWRLVVE